MIIPGITLDKIWSSLSARQKDVISDPLNDLLLKLQNLHKPDLVPLNGVVGEACKDTRRHTRLCRKVITIVAKFKNFIFSDPHYGGSVYIQVLHRLVSSLPSTVVFSHGDIRPANIVVHAINNGQYAIKIYRYPSLGEKWVLSRLFRIPESEQQHVNHEN